MTGDDSTNCFVGLEHLDDLLLPTDIQIGDGIHENGTSKANGDAHSFQATLADSPVLDDLKSKVNVESNVLCIVRMLLDDRECGMVIGKSGFRIKEIREISEASVQLTNSIARYPGSTYRVMKISGIMDSVLSAVHLVLSSTSPEEDETQNCSSRIELRFLIPQEVAGSLIGKNGVNIKNLHEATGAHAFVRKENPKRKLSMKSNLCTDKSKKGTEETKNKQTSQTGYRICSIAGTDRSILQALAILLTQLYEDKTYHELVDAPIAFQVAKNGLKKYSSSESSPRTQRSASEADSAGESPAPSTPVIDRSDLARTFFEMFQSFHKLSSPTPSSNGGMSPSILSGNEDLPSPTVVTSNGLNLNDSSNSWESPRTSRSSSNSGSLTRVLTVPDEVIGTLIGSRGRNLVRLRGNSGASISVSKKGKFFTGTDNRKITLRGTEKEVAKAQELIINHVSGYSTRAQEKHLEKEQNCIPHDETASAKG